MVKEFHEAVESNGPPNRPNRSFNDEDVTEQERIHRHLLLMEEVYELDLAMQEDDYVGVADGIADAIYILCGTALRYGIPLDEVFEEVHRSNMTKTIDPKFREDGKLLKGENYSPPSLFGILNKEVVNERH